MSLFSRFFKKRQIEEYEELEAYDDTQWETGKIEDLKDHDQRIQYARQCLEQMREASMEVERLQEEYKVVNAYLKDMEEIDALPDGEKDNLRMHAQAIEALNVVKTDIHNKKIVMSESDYRKMERLEDEVETAIGKLREAEDYQHKVKKDMQRLEGERMACQYRINEAQMGMANMKGMAIITLIAACALVAILLILQFMLEMDTMIGYTLMAIGVSCMLTYCFLKYREATQEFYVASKSFNKVILLKNKVKIRYVNNTSLLDYLYIKYNVGSVDSLEKMYEKYQVEKAERQRLMETEADMEFHSGQLVKQLRNYHLFDPAIWVHQTEAILNPKEMVEIRHSKILQRQSLRKKMDYNNQMAKDAKQNILDIVAAYPVDGKEILQLVSEFEQ